MPPKRKQTAEPPAPSKKRRTKSTALSKNKKTKPKGFLDLPAELRNRIYELHLVKDRAIEVDKRFKTPALLKTNRQVRREAGGIWACQNGFDFVIRSCNATPAIRFNRILSQFRGQRQWSPSFYVCGHKGWDNVVAWCKKLHSWETNLRITKDQQRTPMESALIAAHEIAVSQRVNSWRTCLGVLEAFRHAISRYDSSWEIE